MHINKNIKLLLVNNKIKKNIQDIQDIQEIREIKNIRYVLPKITNIDICVLKKKPS